MPVHQLIEFLNQLRLDQIAGEAREYFNKLGNGLPIVSKLGQVLANQIRQQDYFLS